MAPEKHPNKIVLQGILDELNRPAKSSDLPSQIELCRKALAMISKETQPKLWGGLLNNLGMSLVQNPMGPRSENIEQAIQCFEQALEVRTRESFPNEWAMTQFNLAGAYYRRIRKDQAKNLECAIQYAHQALDVYTREALPHNWAQVKNTLGEIYRVRICGSRRKNIERALFHFNQALEVHARQGEFPEDWAMIQNNLGNTYLARIRGERADNIELAINCFHQAMVVRTRQADPERWAMTQYNLGNAYRSRIRGDQTENIEQAIFHFEQAMKVRTRRAFPEGWAQTRNNLGNAYLARIRGDRAKNVERAIIHYRQALKVYTDQAFPEDWAQVQNNLGNAYLGRVRGERVDNIEESIHCYQQALKVRTRQGFPEDWAQTLNNLAGAERARAAESIEQAIQRLQASLEVYTRLDLPQEWAGTQNNLAIAYTGRIQGERAENIERAIHHYQQALEVYTRALPGNCLRTARALANLAFEQQRWELARENYERVFDARDALLHSSFSRTSKQTELGEAQNLPPRAAYAHVQCNDSRGAVEVLEKGRAQLLRESLERRWLEELPSLGFSSLYEEYKQAIEQYDVLQKNIGESENIRPADLTSLTLEKVQIAAAAIRDKAGRGHPQYRYFLRTLPFDEIQKQALIKPLVYLCATSAGGLALVVREQGAQAIKLPKLDQASLQNQIWSPTDEEVDRINDHINKQKNITPADIQAVNGGYFSMYALWSMKPLLKNISTEMEISLSAAWQKTLDETTHWLWGTVMGDLVSVLKEYGESVVLIPIGQLAFLPLHAAWTEDTFNPAHRRYALDEMNITYAPSVHALWQASLSDQPPPERVMAVDNPDGSLSHLEGGTQAVLDLFGQSRHLHGNDATLEAVREEMQNANVLHFFTHGNAGWQEEEQARLKLADGYLVLPSIFELHLDQTRLAVLSACETGVPSLKLIDEMIGLPAGMMQAGVPGVVGSLWSVNALSTVMLMIRFYILWRRDGFTPQEALRQAQIWLRDSTKEQKKDFFKSFVERKLSGKSIDSAISFYKYLSFADSNEVDFSSPYYWAAFTYTGV